MINAKATKAGRSRTRCDRLAQMSERKRPMRQAAPVPRTPPRRSAPAASTDDIPNLELQCGHVTPRAAATPIGPPMPLPRPMPLSITSISASELTAHLSDVSPRQTMADNCPRSSHLTLSLFAGQVQWRPAHRACLRGRLDRLQREREFLISIRTVRPRRLLVWSPPRVQVRQPHPQCHAGSCGQRWFLSRVRAHQPRGLMRRRW